MATITAESFCELEDEIKQEFYEDVQAAIKDINECAVILEDGADAKVIDRMFRALHTVKGNCNMVFLVEFVNASHRLEDLFARIRAGEIEYADTYGKFAVIVVNAIDEQLQSLIEQQVADGGVLSKIEKLIKTIEEANTETQLETTEKALIAVQDGHFNIDLVAVDQEHGRAFSFLDATDLEFFQFIIDQQVKVEPDHHFFVEVSESLALSLNQKLSQSIDEQQMRAAIAFVGLSRRLSSNPATIDVEQVFFASGLLSRMSGWGIAAEIALQMRENHDGSGIPQGLEGDAIKPAAQVLSLAVEFALVALENSQAGYKQSLFTAVKAINAQKNTRFKARLIERFNDVIKQEYLTQQKW